MNSMETDKNTVNSYIKEIEGYLNKKRVLYEAEGKRDFVPLIDRTVQMLRTIKDTVSETSSAEQSKSSSSQHTFDRLPGKMYHYAEGEVIDCAICIEQVEAKQAQVRLSCGHIYHLNCLGSHFNHSGDFKCPYCRLEVEEYVKQPRAWEYPVNGPPTQQNLNETNDIPHPGELDFANFQRGVLQVVNSIFGGRLNLGHPFRDDNGTEEEFFDNEAEDGSDVDQVVYEPRFDEVPDSLENSENEYDSEHILSDDSEDEPYELVNNYRYVTLVRRDGRNDTSEIEPPQLSVPHSRSRQPSVSRSHSPRSSISRSRSPPPQTTQSNHHHHRHPDNTTSSIRSRSPSPRDNYYHERERYYGYSSNPSHSPIREIYGGGVSSGTSSRRYENRNLPSFINHSTQMLYERSQNHIERSNSSRNHLFSTIQEEESHRDILRLDNDNSRAESKGSTPFVRTDGSSYNNSNRINYNDTTQPILNETSVAPLMRYETTSDSECEFSNTIFSRHSTTASIMRNMYQEENSSGINDLEDIESSSLSSSSTEHSEVEYDEQDEDEDDERDEHDEEVMYTGSFNWGAENDMDTSDEDTEDDEGYRRCLSRPYSASSDSQGFSSSDEDERNFIPPNTNTSNNRNRNNQSNNRTSNNSTSNETTNQTNQQWFKPWAWYAAHHNTPVYYA